MSKINCYTISVSHNGINDYPDIEYGNQGIIVGCSLTFPITKDLLGDFSSYTTEVNSRTKSYLSQLDNNQIQTPMIPNVIEWDEQLCNIINGKLEYLYDSREEDISTLILIKTNFKKDEAYINLNLRCCLPISYWEARNRLYLENKKQMTEQELEIYKKKVEDLKTYYNDSFDFDLQNNGSCVVLPENKTFGSFSYLVAMANYSKFELIINRGYKNRLPNVYRIENNKGKINIIDTRNYK
jgi:hypothetical protein